MKMESKDDSRGKKASRDLEPRMAKTVTSPLEIPGKVAVRVTEPVSSERQTETEVGAQPGVART